MNSFLLKNILLDILNKNTPHEDTFGLFFPREQSENIEKLRTLLLKIANRLEPRIDHEGDGILKLAFTPESSANIQEPGSQSWMLRFQLPSAYNIATTEDFLDRHQRIEETALRLIRAQCMKGPNEQGIFVLDRTLYEKALKRLSFSTTNFTNLLCQHAKIDPEIMKKAHRDDPIAKAHFKKKGKIGLALLKSYTHTIAKILTELEEPSLMEKSSAYHTSLKKHLEQLRQEEIQDANHKRPILTNFFMVDLPSIEVQQVIAESHLPKDIEKTYSSASVDEPDLHNHLSSIQQTFSPNTVMPPDFYEITRSSTLSSIGLISHYGSLEILKSSLALLEIGFRPWKYINPLLGAMIGFFSIPLTLIFIPIVLLSVPFRIRLQKPRRESVDPFMRADSHEITHKRVTERNKTLQGIQENHELFRKLYRKNILDMLAKQKQSPCHYMLHTILSPLGSRLYDVPLRANPDRAMVEGTAKAIFRYEGRTINGITFQPLYFNEGTNLLRGNGGTFEEAINARAINQLNELVFEKLRAEVRNNPSTLTALTEAELKTGFTEQEEARLKPLIQEKIIFYEQMDFLEHSIEGLQYHSATEQERTQKMKALQAHFEQMTQHPQERIRQHFKKILEKSTFDIKAASQQLYYALEDDVNHIENQISYLHTQRASRAYSYFKNPSPILGRQPVFQTLQAINEHYDNNHDYTHFVFPRSPMSYLMAIIFSIPLVLFYLTGKMMQFLGAVVRFLSEGTHGHFINGETILSPIRIFLRKLGFFSNTKNYDGPTMLASLARLLQSIYHITCKSGEDRTSALDNKRKAYRVCELILKEKYHRSLNLELPEDRTLFTQIFEFICQFSSSNQTNEENMPGGRLQVSTEDIAGDLDHDIPKFMAQLAKKSYSKSDDAIIKKLLWKHQLLSLDAPSPTSSAVTHERLRFKLAEQKEVLRRIANNTALGASALQAQSMLESISYICHLLNEIVLRTDQPLFQDRLQKELDEQLKKLVYRLQHDSPLPPTESALLLRTIVAEIPNAELELSSILTSTEMAQFRKLLAELNTLSGRKGPVAEFDTRISISTPNPTSTEATIEITRGKQDQYQIFQFQMSEKQETCTTSFSFLVPKSAKDQEEMVHQLGTIASAFQKAKQTTSVLRPEIFVQMQDPNSAREMAVRLYAQCLWCGYQDQEIRFRKDNTFSEQEILDIRAEGRKLLFLWKKHPTYAASSFDERSGGALGPQRQITVDNSAANKPISPNTT